jgi:cytochrome c
VTHLGVTIAALVLASPVLPSLAHADGRGQAIFSQRCARCHVVGQGASTEAEKPKLIDVTLAARAHDARWLEAFVQKPTAVDKDSGCLAKLDAAGARHVVHFLRDRLRPVAPTGPAAAHAPVPQAARMQPAAAPEPPRPRGMVHR